MGKTMKLNDIFVAGIVGGIGYEKNFLFIDNIKKYANNIRRNVLLENDITDYDITISDNKIIIENRENDSKKIVVDDETVAFSTGKVRMKTLKENKISEIGIIQLVENISEELWHDERNNFIGFKPQIVIPYEEEGNNIQALYRILNEELLPNSEYHITENVKTFKLEIGADRGDEKEFVITVEKKGKHFILQTDFREKEPKLKNIVEFISSQLTEQYFNWLEEIIKKITNNYECVDKEYLRKGEKD